MRDIVSQKGISIVLGIPQQTKPIRCEIVGRMKLKLRSDGFARLFVKTSTGIREFALENRGDHWYANPALEQGRNERK
jgi:hypothetical protein